VRPDDRQPRHGAELGERARTARHHGRPQPGHGDGQPGADVTGAENEAVDAFLKSKSLVAVPVPRPVPGPFRALAPVLLHVSCAGRELGSGASSKPAKYLPIITKTASVTALAWPRPMPSWSETVTLLGHGSGLQLRASQLSHTLAGRHRTQASLTGHPARRQG
jgi:hypothetical protein